jgi:hypothetical protein
MFEQVVLDLDYISQVFSLRYPTPSIYVQLMPLISSILTNGYVQQLHVHTIAN